MRLGQLSRKIKVKSTEIIDFTELEYGVKLDASLNAKVDDHLAKQIIAHFAEAVKEVSTTENQEAIIDESIEDSKELIEEIPEIIQESEIDSITDEFEPLNVDNSIPESEVIKAKAEKLEGLKVIGKIDLPPPPPPEMIEIDGVMYEKNFIKQQKKEEREKKRLAAQKRNAERREKLELKALEKEEVADTQVNKSIKKESFAEVRKVEERAFQLRKEKEEKERRLKQEKHYQEKHFVASAPRPKKKVVKNNTENETPILKEAKPVPKSLLGKFWRWMNSY